MKILRAGAVPWTAISFVLILDSLISIAYLDACGDPGILLVNGKPLPDGTTVRTEGETILGTTGLKTGTFAIFSKNRLTCDWQRRSDGELHALPREQSQYTTLFGERTTHGALEGVALVGRKLDGKWEFGLESGTASKDQTEALHEIFPPLFSKRQTNTGLTAPPDFDG
jgi:hypothetical protein